MLIDGFVKKRLGKAGFVPFIVAIFSVTEQIDEHILLKPLTELHGQIHGKYHGLGIIPVHVENR